MITSWHYERNIWKYIKEEKYYLKCGMTKVKFEKYETVVEAVEDCNIVDNKGYITVISHDKDTYGRSDTGGRLYR